MPSISSTQAAPKLPQVAPVRGKDAHDLKHASQATTALKANPPPPPSHAPHAVSHPTETKGKHVNVTA